LGSSADALEDTMLYEHKVFEDESIELDGNSYRDCKFIGCRLVFFGTAGVDFDDCLFRECNWTFQGYAAITLGLLAAFYRGARPGSDGNLLDELVEAIKEGKISAVEYPELQHAAS
jgi:hypothetical protein